jgi:hypothetical protein
LSAEVTTDGRPWDEIRAMVELRRGERSPLVTKMVQVRDRYNADYVLLDPSNQSDDKTSVLTPGIVNEAIDQPAIRAASVLPNIYVPPANPDKLTGKGSHEYAAIRRRSAEATWMDSNLQIQLRKAFRHLRAYATTCFHVVPDWRNSEVKIELRDPLSALPEPKAPEDLSLPRDCAFIVSRSAGWLRATFPAARMVIPDTANLSELWDMVEWIDEEAIVYGIIGPRIQSDKIMGMAGPMGDPSIELARYKNHAGCCPVLMPQAVSLDQAMSSIGQIIGHMDLAAQLFALEIQAVKHSIWPDRYVIGSQMGAPRVVGGTWKEGHTGEVNLLENVQSVGELRGTPDPSVERMQDRLERNARVTSGALPQFGGEAGGQALRTGRGLDTMGAWAIDGRVQELQEVMEPTLRAVNEAMFETYKGCFGTKKFHMMNTRGFVDFVPSKHFEDTHNSVSYAIAGADKQGTTIQLGQLIGTQLMSHRTGRMLHPDIKDPEEEERLILEEQLDEALKVSILQRASAPDSPGAIVPEDAAKIRSYIRDGYTLDAAVLMVSQERQKIQAAQAGQAQGGPPEGPSELEPHQMQPGLGGPNEGASPGMGLAGGPGVMGPDQAPGYGIQGPSNDLDRFRMLGNALRA